MAVTVETLEKLQRRVTLTLSVDAVQNEITGRLKGLARTTKADGFRPGKVPLSVVAQRFGESVHGEVMNEQVGKAFAEVTSGAKLRVVGLPQISERESTEAGQMAFDAVFEIYPDVTLADLNSAEIERFSSAVDEAAVDRTIEILRKQRGTFAQRPADEGAAVSDRITVDFEGKLDGVPFEGGKAEDFQFDIGEGQMLESFDMAVRGMKVGESKTFPLRFPDTYQNKDVAGKEADFLVTVKKIEAQNLPEVNEMFARSLGILDASVEGLRRDVSKNLEREMTARIKDRNKRSVMDALLKAHEFDVPTTLVQEEVNRQIEAAFADMKQRGIKEVDKSQIPSKIFEAHAERRVRLALVVGELVRVNSLQAKPQQLQAHIEEMAQSYENPSEVMRWYLGDRQRMAEVEAYVVEMNVTDFVSARAKVTDKQLPFDELMAAK
jgi:trigger factor